MLENELHQRPYRGPVTTLLLILAIVAVGFIFVGPFVGLLAALPFYPGTMLEMLEALKDPTADPGLKIPLYIMQGFATLIGLIVGPALFLARDGKPISVFFTKNKLEILPMVITIIVVIVFMVVNSVFIEWNSTFDFPSFADDFERWARGLEDEAERTTEYLTTFASNWEVLIAIFVIAILPGIGEELVFRGLIQNELFKATKNIHVSIWFAAFLFSAIHFQFFGFVPRLLLGALFGYIYYWSGNLSLAILAHFVNNGVSVLAIYFHQKGTFDFDMETPQAAPANAVIFASVVTAGLLYYFYKYFEHRKPSLPPL
ncbi:MAG TPA: CPBP family intramembrane glutamic endopeptidase [Chryseosolibacter sp.]